MKLINEPKVGRTPDLFPLAYLQISTSPNERPRDL